MQTFTSAVGMQRPRGIIGVVHPLPVPVPTGQSLNTQPPRQPQQESYPVHGDGAASQPLAQ